MRKVIRNPWLVFLILYYALMPFVIVSVAAQRGYGAVGGEYMLLIIPLLIKLAWRLMQDIAEEIKEVIPPKEVKSLQSETKGFILNVKTETRRN